MIIEEINSVEDSSDIEFYDGGLLGYGSGNGNGSGTTLGKGCGFGSGHGVGSSYGDGDGNDSACLPVGIYKI